jgi:WD40 repeat protein
VAHFDGAGSMVAWHPREDYFIAGIGASIYFFDPADSEPFRVITIPAQVPEWAVAGLEFSPDGTRLAMLWGGNWETSPYDLWILDVGTGEVELFIDAVAIWEAHWSPNGTLLAGIQVSYYPIVENAPEESTFMIWDSHTGELGGQYRPEEYTSAHEEDITENPAALTWLSDTQIIAASGPPTLSVIDLERDAITMLQNQPDQRGEEAVGSVGSFLDRMGRLQLIDWRADGNLLALVGNSTLPHNTGEITIWDLDRGQLAAILEGHTWFVTSVAWHPDDDLLASGSMDDTMRLWNTVTYSEIASFSHDNFVSSIAWNQQGNFLASVTQNGTVYLWEVSVQND